MKNFEVPISCSNEIVNGNHSKYLKINIYFCLMKISIVLNIEQIVQGNKRVYKKHLKYKTIQWHDHRSFKFLNMNVGYCNNFCNTRKTFVT